MKTRWNPAEEATDRHALGLFALTKGVRSVPLPLKTIDARFEACGDAASVVLEQIFEFDGPNPVDVLYTFPLPENASVHDCELRVGSRSVKAKIKPLEDARQEYRNAKAAGHRAALVETVRDNLFELQLGNVQPGDEILIRLAFIVPLSGGSALRRRLRIPTCPGIRYVPGRPVGADGGTDLVPDAGRLNPLRIGADDPDAAVFYCAGTIVGGTNIESPSHQIEILPPTPDGRMAVMSTDECDGPDRDFILTWEPVGVPLALMSQETPDYLLCSIHAPADLPGERGARDIFFLLDASGSMNGVNWFALVEAFELALAGLAANDRVAVDLFANHLQPVSNGLLAAHSPKARELPARLRNHRPDGGTEFTSAFDTTIAKAREARRPVVVVITDGQFGDETRACAIAAACDIEVHTIGIDANVNETALQKIARRTRGTCSLCVPGEDLDVTIQQLIANLLSPCIDRITASGGWKPVGNLPALRPGQAALVPFRDTSAIRSGPPAANVDLELKFTDGSMRVIHLPVRTTAGHAPTLLAAKAEITALLDDGKAGEAVATACRHNLLCEGVAFVAWDEAEQVAIATREHLAADPAGGFLAGLLDHWWNETSVLTLHPESHAALAQVMPHFEQAIAAFPSPAVPDATRTRQHYNSHPVSICYSAQDHDSEPPPGECVIRMLQHRVWAITWQYIVPVFLRLLDHPDSEPTRQAIARHALENAQAVASPAGPDNESSGDTQHFQRRGAGRGNPGDANLTPGHGTPGDYARALAKHTALIEACAATLLRLLTSDARPKRSRFHRSGHALDLRVAMQFEADPRQHERLWQRVSLPRRPDPAFVLLVDGSASMAGQRAEFTFAALVVLREVCLRLGIPLTIIAFANDARLLQAAGASDSPSVQARLAGLLDPCGGTDINPALDLAAQHLNQCDNRHCHLWILSDGDTQDPEGASMKIRAIRRDDTHVYGLGLGPDSSEIARLIPGAPTNLSPAQLPAVFARLLQSRIATRR